MLFLAPPDANTYNYSIIKSVGAGLVIDVGSSGATNAITISTAGVVNAPQGLQVGGNSVVSTAGGQTIAGTTYFSGGESLNVYGIRGRFTNEYMHLYYKVGIGHPGGWGQGEGNTPGHGLSTYGGANFAYGNNADSTFNGIVYSTASFRAPIYYDSANTNYYGDFAGTSNLNVLYTNYLYIDGTQLTGTQTQLLKNTLDVTTLPYKVDITVNGNANTFYAVQFWGGDQDVWRRIIIKRGYGETAPWDPIGTGQHHGGLLLDWEGNFGGWGGAEYADRLRVFNESYTNVCADMFIYSHSMGYVFMLRGGGAIYHLFSDQPINGFYQSGSPDILYSTSTLSYDDTWSGTNQYDVPAPAPLSLAQVNSSRIDGLRTKKQSLLDNRYLRQGVDISGIGTVTATNFLATNAFYLNSYNYYLNSANGGIYTNARFETAGNLVVGGNSYLGNGNGDEVHINDILRVGATDSGDAHFYFGEGGSAGSDYGSHWYWDSGYTFTWNTRNAGTDTALFSYVTNDTTYVNWSRHFNMQNREVNYVSQLHFNAGTRFINNGSNYLNFQVNSDSYGSIQVRDQNSVLKGHLGYFDANGFGLLNSSGSWGIRLNPGNGDTILYSAGNWRVTTISAGISVNGNVYTNQNFGDGLVGVYSSTRYQGVFAMGDSYKLSADGTSTGTLYGIAWTHTNVGGQSKSGLGHQALFMDNGVTQTAIGYGIWTNGLITTTSYGTSANWNTAYGWGNHASAGYLTSGSLSGYATQSWVNSQGFLTSVPAQSQLISPNGATVVAADSAMPNAGHSFIHSLALGPGGNDGHILGMSWAGTNSVYGAQIFLDTDPNDIMAIRSRSNAGVWTSWKTIYHSGNFTDNSSNWNTAFGWGNHASAGYVTSSALSSYVPRSGAELTEGNYFYFRSNRGAYLGATDSAPLQAYATGGNAAFMSFHRGGNYAVNFGLDSDNIMRIGGWSASADRWVLDMSGNNTVAGSFRAPIFYDSADTSYYLDPNSTSRLYYVNAPQGYVSVGNPWGTANSAYFPNGITTAGSDNWIYGHTYVGNAPSNGSGHEFWDTGKEYHRSNEASSSHGASGRWITRQSANGNYAPYSFESDYGNHSYGVIARYHISNNGGSDRPSIMFSSGYTNTRWNVGYCYPDDQFRITQNLGLAPDGSDGTWGSERLRIDTSGNTYAAIGGTLYANGSAVISSANIGSQSVSYATTSGALTSMNISQFTNNSGYITGISFASVSSKPTTISGYGITDAITTANIGSQSVSYAATAGSAPANGGNSSTVGGYSVSVGASANTIPTRNANGYLIPESWIQLNGIYGLYSPTNGAHLRPNDGSYGSWRIEGSRNNYRGLQFATGTNGDVSLMIHVNSNITGFHNTSYDWQFYWSAGTLYCFKNNYGGGTQATVLDSSNYSSWAQPIASAINTGNIGSQSVSYASSAGSVAWTNVSSRPTALSQFTNDLGNYGGFLTSITAHSHAISDVSGLQTALDGKQASGSYLTTSGKAADSELIDGIDSFRIVYGDGDKKSTNFSDMNAYNQSSGFFFYNQPTGNPFSDWTNWINVMGNSWNNNYGFQIAHAFHSDGFAVRRVTNGSFASWRTIIDSGNIGSQSVSYASSAGSVAWTNVSSRPTALSQFSNDLGNYGGWITSSGSISGSAGSVTGLTLTSSANGINPDSVTQNQIGYNTSVSLFGQTDGGLYSSAYSSSWIHQIYGDFRTGQIAIRGKNSGSWQAWRTVLDSSNYTSYAPGLTGSGASGTWGINVTGSAGSVGGYAVSGTVGANTVVIRDVNGYIYAHYINSNVSETENPTINSFYTSNGDGWLRKSSVAHVKSQLGLGSMAYESSGTYQTVSGAINTGNIGSQSVSYATTSQQLTKFGDIYGQDWNSYYINGKMIVSSVYGGSGPNFPTGAYNYGAMLSYGVTGSDFFQVYFPENGALQGGAFRKLHYRTGWNGSWSAWKSVVDQEGQVCTIAGSNQTGIEIHSNVGYNQDPLTYFLMRGQADTSWKALKVRLTGDAGGQDIEFRRIAENGTDSRMWYVPRGANTVNFDYPIVQPSDSRLKDNITPISTPVDKIKSLRGVEFDWNSGEQVGTHDVGLIAQDVEAVLPEAVTTQEDGYKNLAYTKVIPLLVEAMKEQQAMIEALKAEIELLKNK
jgi:hypothetical protein